MVMYEIFTVGELKFELTECIDASGSVIFKYFLRTYSLCEVVSDQAKNNKRDNDRKKKKKRRNTAIRSWDPKIALKGNSFLTFCIQ